MFRYVADGVSCRSVVLQEYVGEQNAPPCGRCDRCRARLTSSATNAAIDLAILQRLKAGEMTVKDLLSDIEGDLNQVLKQLSTLIATGKIIETDAGKVRING